MQAVDLLAMVVVARLYSPEAIGTYSVILAVLAMAAVLATGRYERAIILSASPTERRGLLAWCALLSLVLGGAMVVVLYGWAVITRTAAVTLPISLLAGVAVTIGGNALAVEYVALRDGRFRGIAGAKISGAVIGGLIRCLPLIGVAPTSELLVSSMAFGPAFTCGVLGWRAMSQVRLRRATWFQALRVARRNRAVALDLVPASFLNTASGQVPNLVVAQLLSVGIAAQFFLGQRVLLRPMGIVINSIADAGLHDAVHRPRGELREVYRRRVVGLSKVALILIAACWFAGPWGVRVVFGSGWEPAGSILGILAFGVGVQLVFTPFSNFFLVTGATGMYLRWAVFRVIAVVAGVAIGVSVGYGLKGAAIGLAIGQAASFMVQHVLLWRHLDERTTRDFA